MMANPFVCVRNDDVDGLRAHLSQAASSHFLTIRFRDTDATILHEAAKGSIGCLRALIEHGANVNAATWAGRSRRRPRTQENTARQTPLHWACIHGRAPCAEALCQAGANLDVADEDGRTPLFHALRGGHRRVVMTLLRAGAKPNLDDEINDTQYTLLSVSAALDLARAVKRAGDWAAYVAQHKRVLVGLVNKCRPMPDDAAGLVVEFMCPPGGF
jgi:hypothetical protein